MSKVYLSESIQILQDMCAKYPEFASETDKKIKSLQDEINSFVFYVPFIGLFSAGKSDLLNYYMGIDILPVDQPPTTSLATELVYGNEKKMVIVNEHGGSSVVENLPSNAEEANTSEFEKYLKAICYVPSQNLNEIGKIVIVDMPGTDSGIETHTRALFQYLSKGIVFFVVIDVLTGTVPQSIAQILQNISNKRNKQIVLVMHKSDKYHKEKITSVSSHILDQIELILGYKPDLLVTSTFDKNTPKKVHEKLLSLNTDKVIIEEFSPIINQIAIRLSNQIKTLLQALDVDTSELDAAIYAATQAKNDVEILFEKNKRKINQNFSNNALNRVLTTVNNNLEAKIDSLCSAAMQDDHALSILVTSIVEESVQQSLQHSLELQFNTIALDLESLESIDIDHLQTAIKSATTGTMTLLSAVIKGLSVGGKLYKFFTTTLAIMTNIVAPVIEVLIVFLPEILSFFTDTTEKRKQHIKSVLRNRLFPDIRANLAKALRDLLPELESEAFEALRSEFMAILDERKAALEEAIKQKNNRVEVIIKRKEGYVQDIKVLELIVDKLGD